MIYLIEPDYKITEHFLASELACKGSSTLRFHENFLEKLEELRKAWGKPMTVNSCCRSPEHNRAVKGHPRSLHLTAESPHPINGTLAIDFNVHGMHGDEAGKLHTLMQELGWSTGYNVSAEFIHCDMRTLIGLERRDFFY